ncbi:MAG: hypothetical protein ABSE50_26165 [Xanthobacteraceae bacterium]|jgi:hypothetical protein
MSRFSLLARLVLALTVNYAIINSALGQQPTQQQRDAIRASCRSDFISNCAGVEPGGRDAFECLLRNQSKLSSACQDAVSAVATKPAEPPTAEPVAAPETAAPAAPAPQSASSDGQLKSVQKACTISDLMAHCSWLQPTNPEILLCLKANSADLSLGCQSVVQSLPSGAPAAAAPSAPGTERRVEPAKKPAEPAKKTAEPEHASMESAPKKPTPQQLGAIRASCRSDFISHCSGVQPGGSAALRCLQSNAAQLSGGCRSALAAVAEGSGGGAAPATSEAAPATNAPAAAPTGPMPQISPREALGILRICGSDTRVFCAGIPMGGGRLIRCLAANASSVSPSCQAALAAAAGR